VAAENVPVRGDRQWLAQAVFGDALSQLDDFLVGRIDDPVNRVVFGAGTDFNESDGQNGVMIMIEFLHTFPVPLGARHTLLAVFWRPLFVATLRAFLTHAHRDPLLSRLLPAGSAKLAVRPRDTARIAVCRDQSEGKESGLSGQSAPKGSGVICLARSPRHEAAGLGIQQIAFPSSIAPYDARREVRLACGAK